MFIFLYVKSLLTLIMGLIVIKIIRPRSLITYFYIFLNKNPISFNKVDIIVKIKRKVHIKMKVCSNETAKAGMGYYYNLHSLFIFSLAK